MYHMSNIVRDSIVLISSLILASCGGGGGNSAAISNTAPAGAKAVIIETQSGTAYDPRIAVDTAGNATAIWIQENGAGIRELFSSRYEKTSGSWFSTGRVDNLPDDAADAAIAFNKFNNDMVAVWCQWNGPQVSVFANKFSPVTDLWEVNARMIGNATGDAQYPQVVIDQAGNITVVWEVYDSGSNSYSMYANRFDATSGGGWGKAHSIETETGSATNPQIAIDGSGNVIAVWNQTVGSERMIYANRYDIATGWEVNGEAIESASNGFTRPYIAMDPAGNAAVVWTRFDGTRYRVLANRYATSSGWLASEQSIENEPDSINSPRVVMNSLGEATVVWTQSDASGTSFGIKAMHYDANFPTGNVASLIATPADYITDLYLATAADDSIDLIWSIDSSVFLHHNSAAVGWGPGLSVEGTTGLVDTSMMLAYDPNGSLFAVWSQEDPAGNSDIWVYLEP